jgi:hypothetical protein
MDSEEEYKEGLALYNWRLARWRHIKLLGYVHWESGYTLVLPL